MFSVEKRNYVRDMMICFLHLKNCYLERVCYFVYKVYELKRGRLGALLLERTGIPVGLSVNILFLTL